MMVFGCHGRSTPSSPEIVPPHRSTTSSPSIVTATDAPTSRVRHRVGSFREGVAHAGEPVVTRPADVHLGDRTLVAMPIFEHPVKTLAGQPSSLARYEGSPTLIVNVASHWASPRSTPGSRPCSRAMATRVSTSSVSRATSSADRNRVPPTRSRRSARRPTGDLPDDGEDRGQRPQPAPDLRRADRGRRCRGPRRRHPLELREVPRRQGRLDHPLLADGRAEDPAVSRRSRPNSGDARRL